MKKIIVFILLTSGLCQAQFFLKDDGLAHTFSIVAIDKENGEMGVAVQSHWFSVGNVVAWAKGGVGAIATQSFVNKSFGPRALDMISNGMNADEVLAQLLKSDEASNVRQVGIVDKNGNIAVHTGDKCIDFAGHKIGVNYSVQSNMMLTNKVPDTMAEAFEQSKGLPLAERMLSALEAAQSVGGDIRGKQSAAIRIVKVESSNEPWNDDYVVDLRVDDNADPIAELGRLLKVHRAYEFMNEGDLQVEYGNMDKAMSAYNAAMQMFPNNLEMQYWTAITLANNGEIAKASNMLQKVYNSDENWRELTKRLPKVGLLTISETDLKSLLK
jgi:uncharacterized Ntn-hydrolase superfamily protein